MYDTKTQTKINAAKSSRTLYRVVVEGKIPEGVKNYMRLNIVVTEDGKFVRTFYG